MKNAHLFSWVAVLGMTMAATPLFSQEVEPMEPLSGDLAKFLNEKEKSFAAGKGVAAELSGEEREHVQRMLRLHTLRKEADIVDEAAGAELPVPQSVQRINNDDEVYDDREELSRENARLRAELRQLRSHLSDMEYQVDDAFDRQYNPSQPRPRFYMPVH